MDPTYVSTHKNGREKRNILKTDWLSVQLFCFHGVAVSASELVPHCPIALETRLCQLFM